jgi:SulP family sulfate permease
MIMLVAGLLKAGRLLRWVPNSEMVGFMTGVAALIILGQLGDLTGYSSEYSNKVVKAVDLLFNLDKVDLPTVAVGIGTILLIIVLQKTRLRGFGLVVAIIVASILPSLFGWTSVAKVSDIADITGGLPTPTLPDFSQFFTLIVPALSLAVIGLIQGAGVSQAFVNPDGRYPDPSRDFIGEGAANIAAGIFQGMPVGGSASATSLVVSSGARTRLANISAGVVIAIVALLLAGAVGKLALPALAGLLIVIGFEIIKPASIRSVWQTGSIQRIVMVITFALVLVIPLEYAVLVGVVLSILLFTVRQSNRIAVVAWKLKEGRLPIEQDPPATVLPGSITVLVPFGSLFYAAAPAFEAKLPKTDAQTSRAVVIINLHARTDLGSTFMRTIDRYAEDLKIHGSRLMLAEVDQSLWEQLARAGIVESISRRSIFLRTEEVIGSLFEAYAVAEEWVSQPPAVTRGEPGGPAE